MRKGWIIAIAGVVGLAVIYAVVMTIGFTRRVDVPIEEAWLSAPDRLVIVVGTCNGGPEATVIGEDPDQVSVKIVSRKKYGSGEDCLDLLEIELESPMGERTLIDFHTDKRVELADPR